MNKLYEQTSGELWNLLFLL